MVEGRRGEERGGRRGEERGGKGRGGVGRYTVEGRGGKGKKVWWSRREGEGKDSYLVWYMVVWSDGRRKEQESGGGGREGRQKA
jgi:hypothetical protein